MRTQSAFTLIQLMFIIAIGTAATVYAFVASKNDISRSRGEKVAYELQMILEASILYFRTETQWPTAMADLIGKNYLPDVNGRKNPWGRDYVFSSPSGLTGTKFSVQTDVSTAILGGTDAIALRISKLLPNVTRTGAIITTSIDSTGKDLADSEGALFVEVNEGVQMGTEEVVHGMSTISGQHRSRLPSNCIPTAQVTKIKNICKVYNRKADYEVAMTGMNVGSMYSGEARYNGSILEPYVPAGYDEVYVKKVSSGSSANWCFNFTIAHPATWDWGALEADRGVYGEVIFFYYCREAAAGPPP